jgi:hypothetical protein
VSAKPGRGGILGASGRAYEWLRKALGFYGTAVTLAQLIPALVALLAVTLSPTAWLSLTLRRWVLAGVIVGSAVGAATFALAMRRWLRFGRAPDAREGTAGTASSGADPPGDAAARDVVVHVAKYGEAHAREANEPGGKEAARPLVPPRRLRAMAYWGLGSAAAALVVLRLHFAVVDVGVIDTWPVLTPLFDFYLGGAAWQATSYNVVAAVLSAAALVGIVLGAPAAAMLRRDRMRARAALSEKGGPLHVIADAEKALGSAKNALSTARSTIVSLSEERDALRAELARCRGDVAGRSRAAGSELDHTDVASTESARDHTDVASTESAGDHS